MHQRNNICLPQRDLARNSRLATLAYFKHDSDHKFKPTEFRLFETAKTLVFRICYSLPMLIYCHTKAVYHTGCLQGCQYVTQTWNQLQNKSSWDVKLSIWITSLPRVLYFDIFLMFISRIGFSVILKDMQCLNLEECNSLKCNIWEMIILEFEILIQLQALSISNFYYCFIYIFNLFGIILNW